MAAQENRKNIYQIPISAELLLFLLAIFVTAINYHAYSDIALAKFGYSNVFINIAKTSLENGYYSSTIEGMTNGVLGGDGFQAPLQEFQREPLYPLVIMAALRAKLGYYSIIELQIVCMILSIFLVLKMCREYYGGAATIVSLILIATSPVLFFYSQVLYPYAINIFGVIVAIYFLRKEGLLSIAIASVGISFAIYERGSLLLLPLFLSAADFASSKKTIADKSKRSLLFLMCVYIQLSPWLYRNYNHDVIGINQMSGYSLGYTYGKMLNNTDVAAITNDSDRNAYIELINKRENGTDGGSLLFIGNLMKNDGLTWAEADKRLAGIMLSEIKAQKETFARYLFSNIKSAPRGFVTTNPEYFLNVNKDNVKYFWLKTHETTFSVDLSFMVIAAAGLLIGLYRKDKLAIFSLFLLLYTGITVFPFVTFDPRYRGCLDLFIYIYCSVGIVFVCKKLTYFITKNLKINTATYFE